jgi:hypothetical protein
VERLIQHPLRAVGAALTLAGAAIVFVVLFVPIASGSSPSGPNEVRGYENSKGQSTHKVGQDELFTVFGKNLDHAVEVYCWDGSWTAVSGWEYSTDSKHLINVDAEVDCGPDSNNHIRVQFDNGTPEDLTDDVFVVGPRIAIKQGPAVVL